MHNELWVFGWDFQEIEVDFPPYLSEQQLPSRKFPSSKSTMETPERRVMCLSCHFRAYSTHCYGISIVDFEQVNVGWANKIIVTTQLIFTCSKSTIETLEKRMKYCKLWTYFTTFSCVSIVDFEHVNVSWVKTWLISIVSNQIIVNDYITQNRFKFCTFQYILLTDHTVHNVYSEIFVSEWMFVSQSCVVGFNPFSGWCSIFILSENTRKQLFSGG